jgi:hypothetical protein
MEAISLNDQNIFFTLKENIIHQRSKSENSSTEFNPHQFELPTDNSRRHHQKETVPHLHTVKITNEKLE